MPFACGFKISLASKATTLFYGKIKKVFSRSLASGNKCYKFVFVDDGADGFNWFDAREACQAESGLNPDLATIKSDEEAGKWITVLELMVAR